MKWLASIILIASALSATAAGAVPHHGVAGGHHGGNFAGHPGGHFNGGHRFDGHRHFRHDRIFVAPFFFAPIVGAPAFVYAQPPVYWYYCPSYGAYYPYVPSCPEPWVPVPAQ